MKYTLLIPFTLIFTFMFGCDKQKITKEHPEFIGTWKHYLSATEIQYLIIGSDGRGRIEKLKDGKMTSDSKPRKWFIKEGYLMFGRITPKDEKFKINIYPTEVAIFTISGFDTLIVGQPLMILNDKPYH